MTTTCATERRPRLKAPPGTCDCHIHVYEPRFPVAPTAAFAPPHAPLAAYQRMCERLGVERTVIVQPSAYGLDNRCTLEAMATFGRAARAVVVIDDSATTEEIARLDALGARGARFFMLKGGVLGWEILETMAARFAPFGWHIQLQLDGRLLPERIDLLQRLASSLVVDHVGKYLEPVAPDAPSFLALLRLVERGRTWVKLSAPYETSKVGAPHYDDVGRLAKALARVAPERMVWATNWPHPSVAVEQRPDDADLLDLLLDWAPDEATRRRILVDNPADLYHF